MDWRSLRGFKGSQGATAGSAAGGTSWQELLQQVDEDSAQSSANAYYPGLANAAGNLCFLNATLQALASLQQLPIFLRSLLQLALTTSKLSPGSVPPTPVINALISLLRALNTPSTSRRAPLRPLELASALAAGNERRRALLYSSDQQDAQEFLVMVLEAISEEAARIVRAAGNTEAPLKEPVTDVARSRGGGLRNLLAPSEGLGAQARKRVRDLRNPFMLLTAQSVTCTMCGWTQALRHTPTDQLNLNVPAISSCSVEQLLAEYTRADFVSDYKCERCSLLATIRRLEEQRERMRAAAEAPAAPSSSSKESANRFDLPSQADTAKGGMSTARKKRIRELTKSIESVKAALDSGNLEQGLPEGIRVERVGVAAKREVKLARTPKTLVLHLSRSSHFSRGVVVKNGCQVLHPEYLDLSPFCVQESSAQAEQQGARYRLQSIVQHFGSHAFGHYVAFRRRPGQPDAATGESDAAGPSAIPPYDFIRVSDETVQGATTTEALRANPFLLFYERVDSSEEPLQQSRESGILDSKSANPQARIFESWRTYQGTRGDSRSSSEEGTHTPDDTSVGTPPDTSVPRLSGKTSSRL